MKAYEITEEALEFIETHDSTHEYSNGDKAIFHTYRFKVAFDYVPKITTDEESVGAFMLVSTILDDQRDFVKRMLQLEK